MFTNTEALMYQNLKNEMKKERNEDKREGRTQKRKLKIQLWILRTLKMNGKI
jgi:hypothetical protein